jgi:hypothetical protein
LRVIATPTTMWVFLFALVALCSQIYYICYHPVAKYTYQANHYMAKYTLPCAATLSPTCLIITTSDML